jgi:hypothetical protein
MKSVSGRLIALFISTCIACVAFFPVGCKQAGKASIVPVASPVGNLPLPDDTVYVAPQGDDVTGNGTANFPVRSIQKGLEVAAANLSNNVAVAGGVYFGPVEIADGVNLLSGYDPDFTVRDFSSYRATIINLSAESANYTVKADGISSATTIEGFVVEGPSPKVSGASSYAIYVRDSGSGLQVINNIIYGGTGAGGSVGTTGGSGAKGGDGGDGQAPEAYTTATHANPGGTAGACAWARTGGSGGSAVTVVYDTQSGSGENGVASSVPYGIGGPGGWNSKLGIGQVMVPAGGDVDGMNGADGADGSNGVGGTAGSGWSIPAGEWIAASGNPGAGGTNGFGGGGGGSGGGIADPDNRTSEFVGVVGATGGGGGAGGQAGQSGGSGPGGGGSF